MNFKEININDFDVILDFLRSNFSSPTHWPDWNLLTRKYFKCDFSYLGLYEKTELIGILPLHKEVNKSIEVLYSGQYHFIPYGGIIIKDFKEFDFAKVPISLLSRIECFSLPEIIEFGTKYSYNQRSCTTLIIDLQKKEDEIWNQCINSKRRNMIRKAEKAGIRIVSTKESFEDFYNLYSDNNYYNKIYCLPYNYFTDLQNLENVHFKPMTAYYNNEPVAAMGLVYDKNYALYWLGVTNKNAQNFGQGELLQWEAIKYSKSVGCQYYDLCYIEKERLPQIYEFKKGFSKREVNVSYLVKRTPLHKIISRITK